MAATAAANVSIMHSLMQVPYEATVRLMLTSLERNLLPDAVVRLLTRILLASRLRSQYKTSAYLQLSELLEFAHCKSLNLVSLHLLVCVRRTSPARSE